MPVSLANPSGLWLLGLLAPLIALYLLRAKRQRRVVPSVWLWQAAGQDLLAERRFRRLLASVRLLIEGATIALLALAVSGPSLRPTGTPIEHLVIVLDTSASMAARDGALSRFDRARAAARAIVRDLRGRDAILVESAKEPHLLASRSRDPRELLSIMDALLPRDEEGDMAAALALVQDRVAQLAGPRRPIV